MKRTQAWHHTFIGSLALWLGSIQFAVPVLVLVAGALAWGTYLESTQSAKVARAAVYGSYWFIGLMALICLSLIFAVVVRYPWKRKHVGFIVVHASLVTLIAAGFWSLFGRIEGRLMLQQGMTSNTLETEQEVVELVEHQMGKFNVIGSVSVPAKPGTFTLGGATFKLVERWDNTREEFEITDNNPEAFRAMEVSLAPMMPTGTWIGDSTVNGPFNLDGLVVKVLPTGKAWDPPAPQEKQGFFFTVTGTRYPLAEEGKEAFPGWTITSVKQFTQATVSAGGAGLSNTGSGQNPAVEVLITDGKGTTERHTAFANFPDMVMAKTVEGDAKSGATLTPTRSSKPTEETLVLFGDQGALHAGYAAPDGTVVTADQSGKLPWTFKAGKRSITILHDYLHAQELSRFVKAPAASDHRPALVIASGDSAPAPLAWKGILPAPTPGRNTILRYGPRIVELPFSITLQEFRKTDYPGTEMAMAYESAVKYTVGSQPAQSTTISMNNPLKSSGWKVYQSGFIGQNTSIFSVMRDPGLVTTYIASIGLCVGILITFYGRNLSWGHPGIPAPFSVKESSHVPSASGVPPVSVVRNPADASPAIQGTVDALPGVDGDPGRRPDHAAGYLRA